MFRVSVARPIVCQFAEMACRWGRCTARHDAIAAADADAITAADAGDEI